MKPCEPFAGVRCPYVVRDSDVCDFLYIEKKPPVRRKDLMDGSETTMMAVAISAIESTTVSTLAPERLHVLLVH